MYYLLFLLGSAEERTAMLRAVKYGTRFADIYEEVYEMEGKGDVELEMVNFENTLVGEDIQIKVSDARHLE